MGTWTNRGTPTSSPFSGRTNLDDLGYGLDYDSSIMCDENGARIVFHTGEYSASETLFTSRTVPST